MMKRFAVPGIAVVVLAYALSGCSADSGVTIYADDIGGVVTGPNGPEAAAQMLGTVNGMGKECALAMFADWTDRIAAGEVPASPPRPQGIERNVVITQWDSATWARIHPSAKLFPLDSGEPRVTEYASIDSHADSPAEIQGVVSRSEVAEDDVHWSWPSPWDR